MKACRAIYAAILLPLCAAAQVPGALRHEFYHRPVEWLPGDTLRDSLPPAFAAFDAHLRVRVASHHRLDISLIYNRRDSLNYRLCRLFRDPAPIDDRIVAAPVYISVSEIRGGSEINSHTHKLSRGLNAQSDDYSLKLLRAHGVTVLVAGQEGEVFRQQLEFDDDIAREELLWHCGEKAAVVRHTLTADAIDEPVRSRFADARALQEYLRESTDSNEGYWVYFDRDSDPLRMSIPGNYRLATVRRDDADGYEIVYLGGAPKSARRWSPMLVKGYLLPTGFIGHFDLVWFDLHGRKQQRETSADITDGSSLTLYFPLHGGSKVRFRKALEPVRQ